MDGVLANKSLQVIYLQAVRMEIHRAGRAKKLYESSFLASY